MRKYAWAAALITTSAIAICALLMNKLDYYKIIDAVKRLNAPDFNEPPRTMKSTDLASVLREYDRRGFKLTCYGGLLPEEKFTKSEDYQCWAIIKRAYNIPAQIVTFSFRQEKLMAIRLEFDEKSYNELQAYLKIIMADSIRLDDKPGAKFGVDIYGKPLLVWATPHGTVTTSGFTPNQTNLVLWVSRHSYNAPVWPYE